jgi:3-oxoacyl-[acyl-carrier protein] reductase
MKLAGKVAIVTGAGSGQGRAVAEAFARDGAAVTVAELKGPSGEETAARIRAAGGRALAVQTDVADAAGVERMVGRTVDAFGPVHILYNNAAMDRPDVAVPDTVSTLPAEHWDAVLAVNLRGVFLCCKFAVPHMIAAGGGAIINVASVLGEVGSRGFAAYCASKHGVIGLTKEMALDLAPHGIRVNAICPGSIDTPRLRSYFAQYGGGEEHLRAVVAHIPLGRVGTVEDIARAAVFLASDDASYISGHALAVDGGLAATR